MKNFEMEEITLNADCLINVNINPGGAIMPIPIPSIPDLPIISF